MATPMVLEHIAQLQEFIARQKEFESPDEQVVSEASSQLLDNSSEDLKRR